MSSVTSIATSALERPTLQRSPIRYKNHFRWRIMPPEDARTAGFYDRSFENKKKAVAYQKQVKRKFPNQPCCVIDTGKWYDSLGRAIR